MDNKFSQIAKIKKQQMDKIETKLMQTKFEQQKIQQKIASLYEEIENSSTPTGGAASLISLYHESMKVLRREKDDYTFALRYIENEIKKLQNEYKKANLEFEKVKYLEQQEIEKRVKEIQRKEKIDMDEIAMMLFSSSKGV